MHGAYKTGGCWAAAGTAWRAGHAIGCANMATNMVGGGMKGSWVLTSSLPPNRPPAAGEVQAVRIKKWWKAHHEQIERLLAEQRQQQQQGEQQVLAAVDGGEAAAGGRRPRAAAATAKQRLASAAADS